MDDNQENRFTAALTVRDFLKDNAPALTVLPQIADAKDDLDDYILNYVEADGTATLDYTGSAAEKLIQRTALISATLRLSRGVKALATDTGDIKLLHKVDLVKTDLSKLRDSQLYVNCKQIKELTTPIIASLAPYLVLPAQLTAQSDALEAYFEAIPEPADQTDERQLAGKEADKQLNLIYVLFNTRLDTYMDLLVDDEPALVDEYYLARAIGDNSGGSGNASGNGNGTGNTDGNSSGNQPIVFSGSVDVMMTQATDAFTYNAAMSVTVKTTTTTLSFKLGQDGVPVGSTKNVSMGTTQVFTITEFYSSGNMFIITNNSADMGGYTITLN